MTMRGRRKAAAVRSAGVGRVPGLVVGPFRRGAPRLIVHCAYHKVGTAWFNSILSELAVRWGVRFVTMHLTRGKVAPPIVALDGLSNEFHRIEGPYRATHMIRDPRDCVVSGYHYHRKGGEEWLVRPMKENAWFDEVLKLEPTWAEKSYQEMLAALAPEEGLRMEVLVTSALTITPMAAWDYHRPDFLELRYEDVFRDGPIWFERIFDHYGLRPAAVRDGLKIADQRSFAKVRASGDAGPSMSMAHLRSGEPQQWREEFTPAVTDLFKSLHGMDLVTLGYERSLDW
jgi:hypothetical protein